MIAASIYLLKVIICSGILYGYYHLFLRNKIFHEWNRFYLLAIVPLSILLPLIDPHIIAPAADGSKIVTALQVVAGADEFTLETNPASGFSWSADLSVFTLYALMSLATAFIFIRAWAQLMRMIRRYKPVALENFYFLNTTEPGTPFSFFRYLVWNREIEVDSDNGKRILEHELVHIREKHSWDKAFLHIVLVFFWINPIFWLIRKEISMIHEFIADRKSVSNGDVKAFARLILEASFPGHSGMLTQSFFQSSIKRRLAMITKKQNPLAAYISRLMMIPLLFTLLFTFAVKAEKMIHNTPPPVKLEKKFTVVLDAGHGGDDAGAMAAGITEKDMNMELVRAIQSVNNNPNIQFVLTRTEDRTLPLPQRVEIAKQKKADLFLSLHTASSPDASAKGIFAFVSKYNLSQQAQNVRLASLLLSNLSSVYTVDKNIRHRDQRLYVLDNNECPAVILECGHISNEGDRKFLSAAENREKLATQIIRSIEDYFSKTVFIQPAAPAVQTVPAAAKAKDTTAPKKAPPAKVTFLYLNGTSETLTIKEYRERTGREDLTFLSDTIRVNGNALPRKQADGPVTVVAQPVTPTGDPGQPVMVIGYPIKKEDSVTVVKGYKLNGDVKAVEGQPFAGEPTYYVDGWKVSPGVANAIDPNEIDKVNIRKGTNGNIIEITLKKNSKIRPPAEKPLYIVNGKEISPEEMDLIDTRRIESVNVLKGKSAETIYGEKGKYGVVVVTLKKAAQ